METPRPVPNYVSETLSGQWYYCLYCKHSMPTEFQMVGHVKNVHTSQDDFPTPGEDYTNGTHLRIMLARWEQYSLLAVDHFTTMLESLRGADDFAFEVGEGLPDAE